MTTEKANQVVVAETAATSILAVISRAAADPSVDIAKMSSLLDMQERIMGKQAEMDFNAALSRVSAKLADVKIVRSQGVSYKAGEAFKFAPYEKIDAAIRPILTEEGFSLSFNSEAREGGGAIITGTLSHAGGHSRKASLPLALDNSGGKNNIQGMGSTISYGKRYTATMLLNIVTVGEDDDGAGDFDIITTEQAVEIALLLNETNSDKARFLKWIGAKDVQSIAAKEFDKAVAMLQEKKAGKK